MSHFTDREFACPCGCTAKVSPLLVARLDVLRERLGHPIRVTSGARCQAHQDKLKAEGYPTATKSPHVPGNYDPYGLAADISTDAAHFERLRELALGLFPCVGIAKTWLHVDIRADKRRSWFYP